MRVILKKRIISLCSYNDKDTHSRQTLFCALKISIFSPRFKNVHEEIKRCIQINNSRVSHKFLHAIQLYKYHGANNSEIKKIGDNFQKHFKFHLLKNN